MKYPETYLHVRDENSGEEFVLPIRGNGLLDITHQTKRWIKQQFGGELMLDGKLQSGLSGDYYARIMTDGRSPDSVVCWQSGGFYLQMTTDAVRQTRQTRRNRKQAPGGVAFRL